MSILHSFTSIVLLLTLAHALPSLQNSTDPEGNNLLKATNKTNYRLPPDVSPSHYIIKLVPKLEPDFSFEGDSSINIKISAENVTTITLHAKNLKFEEKYTTLVGANNQILKPVNHSINNETDFLTVRFESQITPGSYWLNLQYNGSLNEDLVGFFRDSYVNEKGEKVWLAATQFEPTYARQAFPCFDEPAMKATFEISIKHLKTYTAISNMPAISNTTDKVDLQKIWTNFETTPCMSTYLVAFVVFNFDKASNHDGNLSCWSQKDKIGNCIYALEIGPEILVALEKYMGSGFVVPKIDNVALPRMKSAAMENWGLITYREDVLLYKEGVTKTLSKQITTMVICHEYVHQWFGNLVTLAWWDYLWLNEGFASYFQYFITDMVEPDWRLMDQMVIENLQRISFLEDQSDNVSPMNVKVNSPSEIKKNFNMITYSKAACVIRMISHILGDKVFQGRLRQYLKLKKYRVATSDDLFTELGSTAENFPNNISLKEALDSWVDQAGYPVIHVNRLSASPGYVSINQTRVFWRAKINTTSTELWWIPVNYATQSNPNFNDTQPSHWLPPSGVSQKIPFELSDNQWFIVNKQQTGYYRVNYEKENWALIADYLNTPNYTNIHVLNRAQLLDDSFNLIQSRYLDDISVFLNISRYLAQEDDYIPWFPAILAFQTFNYYLENTQEYNGFKSYVLKRIEKVGDRFGYSETLEDDHFTKLYRSNIIKWACMMGSAKCANATRNSLIEHVYGSKNMSADIREVSFCAGIRMANATTWNKTFDLYFKVNDNKERDLILLALGCSLDPNIINSYLEKLIDPDSMNRLNITDGLAVLEAVAVGNETGIDTILDFVIKNVKTLPKYYGESFWSTLFESFDMYGINTDAQIEKLNTLVDEAKINTTLKSLIMERAREEALRKAEWLAKHESQIRLFLQSENSVDGSTTTSLSC